LEPEDFKRLTQQRVLMAPITDRGGRPVGPHPVVILVPPATNNPEATLEVACGSRDTPVAGNTGFAIRAAGSRGPAGQPHPRTGLLFNTWFYAGWLRTIRLSEVVKLCRFVAPYDYAELLRMIRELQALDAAPPESP